MPRLLRFTFCFVLFAAQPAPSLHFSFAARLFPTRRPAPASPSHRFCRPPEPLLFLWFLFFLFAPLSLRQNRVSRAKSASLTFEDIRSRGFFYSLWEVNVDIFFASFRQKASGFISARVAVQTRVQGVYIHTNL